MSLNSIVSPKKNNDLITGKLLTVTLIKMDLISKLLFDTN
jgi:hypothetical protein